MSKAAVQRDQGTFRTSLGNFMGLNDDNSVGWF